MHKGRGRNMGIIEEWRLLKLLRPLATNHGRLMMEGIRRQVTPDVTHYDVCDGSMLLRVTLPEGGTASNGLMSREDLRRHVGSEGTAPPKWGDASGYPDAGAVAGEPAGEAYDGLYAPWRVAAVLTSMEKIAKAAGHSQPSVRCCLRRNGPTVLTIRTADICIVGVIMPHRE